MKKILSLALLCAIIALAAPVAEAACTGPAALWRQTVEYKSSINNSTGPAYYYRDKDWCDDGNDPDLDYIFVFRPSYNCDPDSLRWYSSSWWVWAFLGSPTAGSRSHWDDDVHVCVGPDRVKTIGGGNETTGLNRIWYNLKVGTK